MQVTFLGTNGWFDTPAGNTCSALVQSEEYDIIFDAGNGIAKADRYITQKKPVYLFISHLHIDHIAGLHTLVKFRLKKCLHICTQKGSIEDLNAFVREPFTVPFSGLPYKTDILELAEGRHKLPFTVECLPLIHPAPCFGYRLELEGKVITYCTDTGVCDNAITLGRNADLLITECGLRPGEESPGWPHLNPDTAIAIARLAKAKRLALMHFGAEVYKTVGERLALKQRYEKEWPGLIVTIDELSIQV
ncbi:MAG: ribonuclease Z [Methanomicrobiales archaeon]